MMCLVKQIVCCIVVLSHMQLFSCAYDFVQYHIVDTSRQEIYPHDDAHPYRELMMHMWVPVAEIPCPLILFSHGLGDNFNGMTYTQLCQYCASQGYVVASVSHSYGCKPIQFLDGRVALYLFPARLHQQPDKHMFDVEADMWVADMECALVECARQNKDETSLLYNKIDMSHIGIMGHSLGGSVAMLVGRRDSRIRAIINLDGPLYGTNIMQPLDTPLMVILGSLKEPKQTTVFSGGAPLHTSFLWRWHFDQVSLPQLNAFISAQHSDVYKITIDGIVHDTFSDAALIPDPVIARWLIDGNVAHTMIHSYVGAFFDTYVKGVASPLLDCQTKLHEKVEIHCKK